MLARLSTGETSIYSPIKRLQGKTFATVKKVLLQSKKECRQVANRSATKQVIDVLTSGKTAAMTLEELMNYRITSVSLSIFTTDGLFHKPVKSKFMTLLNLEGVSPPDKCYILIDVGMAWNKVPPSKTWSQYARSLYNYITNRHPQAVSYHFINDIYDEEVLSNSTKFQEQQRRAQSLNYVSNIFSVGNHKMPVGSAWRAFLSKLSNKQRLQKFLLREWHSYMCHVDMYFTERTSCYDVRTGNHELRFEAHSASEADTRAFFHAAQIDHSYPVVFDFEDTDAWTIASYASHLTEQDMYMYRKRPRNAPVYHSRKSLFRTSNVVSSALGVYTFTGVDTVGVFFLVLVR